MPLPAPEVVAGPDPATLAAYDRGAATYARNRRPRDPVRAEAFAAATGTSRRLVLGCGPGLWFPHLGRPLVGADASAPMLRRARDSDRSVPLVRTLLEELPFARAAFGGVWAGKCLQHVEAADLPLVLAGLHRVIEVDGRFDVEVFTGSGSFRSDDDLPGRRFTLWDPDEFCDVVTGAGFRIDERVTVSARDDRDLGRVQVSATRLRTLPDTVGQGLRLLVCGLNPSLVAADAGVGFSGPTNRFWKALHRAGLSTVDRDARVLLVRDGIGMTDLVKRATRAAKEVRPEEYRTGLRRLTRLVARTRPAAVCLVGLAGWRTAVDAWATAGWQADSPLAAPTYVMPSTSGLNAHQSLDDLADHLARAATLP
jgi:TDG/mug DNA glycosylase family protein